jgi:tryptophan synthase alpha chain
MMNNRIDLLFTRKSRHILSVYFTAGFPALHETVTIIELLEKTGADMVEIGIPFSDPTADGPTIQHSNDVALKNGMSLELLFHQLENIREKVQLPLILMGYFNPVLQYGVERFCKKCRDTGIDGVILPDLPPEEYIENYKSCFEENGLSNILLIAPQTTNERILEIDRLSKGFVYVVSSSATTGSTQRAEEFQTDYFTRVQKLGLTNPRLIGFGISDKATFDNACNYANGAIIGSAFVKALLNPGSLKNTVIDFITSIKHGNNNDQHINFY